MLLDLFCAVIVVFGFYPTFAEPETKSVSLEEQERRLFQAKEIELQKKTGALQDAEAEFRKLTEQKELAKDPKAKAEIMLQMKETHLRYLEAREKMLSSKKEIQYRYPNRGKGFERNFKQRSSKRDEEGSNQKESSSAKEQKQLQTNTVLNLARKKYPLELDAFTGAEFKQVVERAPASVKDLNGQASKKKKKIKLER